MQGLIWRFLLNSCLVSRSPSVLSGHLRMFFLLNLKVEGRNAALGWAASTRLLPSYFTFNSPARLPAPSTHLTPRSFPVGKTTTSAPARLPSDLQTATSPSVRTFLSCPAKRQPLSLSLRLHPLLFLSSSLHLFSKPPIIPPQPAIFVNNRFVTASPPISTSKRDDLKLLHPKQLAPFFS